MKDQLITAGLLAVVFGFTVIFLLMVFR